MGEWTWVVLISLAIVLVASIPYLFGYLIAPPGHAFLGLTHNVDDALVYLSWMRQAADGHFFTRNLFTSEAQSGRGFNLLFYVMGRFAGVAHLPLILVFHLARVLSGIVLLCLVYAFARQWIADLRTRRLVLLVVGLSSGLGWLVPIGEGAGRSVDLWQPEAVTFLSLYLSPLFSFSLVLVVGSLFLLHLHSSTGLIRFAVIAGLLLFVLGNVHTYDVLPVGLAWTAFALMSLFGRPRNPRPVIGGLVAGAIGSLTVGYQAYLYVHEPVFRLRADVPTLSPSVVCYLLGLGLLMPLAVLGIMHMRHHTADYRLLLCWALATFVSAYLPVAFQRKLIMGVHIPLSILAASGIAVLASRGKGRAPDMIAAAVVMLLIPSNVVFMSIDMNRIVANEAHTTAHTPFISSEELAVLEYLRRNAGANDFTLAQPWFASLVPAYAGRPVYCGHWGETARFGDKLHGVWDFFTRQLDVKQREGFLREGRIGYVVDYGQLSSESHRMMRRVFRSGDITVYRVY
jgi:hypothetical protein